MERNPTLQICLLHSAFQFSTARSKLSAFQFSLSFLLLLPPRAAPPASASASRLRRRPHRRRLEDDELSARVFGFLHFWVSRLALLLSGLEDDEQWLGFPGPPSSRYSSGFISPPEGCLISSSINSWSSSRKRRRNRRRPKQWLGFEFGVRFQDSENVAKLLGNPTSASRASSCALYVIF
ncbi:hypothetical protein Drorol1_Dr00002539 [Drosera rotundifolia]